MLNKEEIFEVLNFWNYWNRDVKHIISRKLYEDKLKLLKKAKKAIAIKGVRRCGKSTLLKLEIDNLIKQKVPKKQILFVNFEEPKFTNFLNLELFDKIYETYVYFLNPDENKKQYIFLDEVQNIKGFEKWVNKMSERNIQIYITGSNSKLLSNEFSTILGGRYLQVRMFPLSFREFLKFNKLEMKSTKDILLNKIKIQRLFKKYLVEGGFPKLTEFNNQELKKEEINTYFLTIILKDIGQRYNLSNTNHIKKLSLYLLSNISKIYSVNNLNKMGFGAYDTIKEYINYLKEVYLFFTINKFDYSLKKQILNPKKIYSIDTGITNYLCFSFSENLGRQIENLVFLHFKRYQNYEIYYHKNKFECDFLLKEKGRIVKAIQVTKTLNFENEKREVLGLVEACKTYNLKKGLILIYEGEEKTFTKQGIKIEVRQIWKFLLLE